MTQILDLKRQQDENGRNYYTATVVDGDARIPVDCRYGSWQATADGHFRPVLPGAAADLQAAVKTLLRREKESHAG